MKRDKELENNPEFREYRRKMHQSLVNPDDNPVTREEEARAETGRKPLGPISKTPISLVLPKRFFTARSKRRELYRSPSK